MDSLVTCYVKEENGTISTILNVAWNGLTLVHRNKSLIDIPLVLA